MTLAFVQLSSCHPFGFDMFLTHVFLSPLREAFQGRLLIYDVFLRIASQAFGKCRSPQIQCLCEDGVDTWGNSSAGFVGCWVLLKATACTFCVLNIINKSS